MLKVFIGGDHGGWQLKKALKEALDDNYQVIDCGAPLLNPEDDYPPIAFKVAQQVVEHQDSFGILLCRSGSGMVIAANKVAGSRAVFAPDAETAKHARADNNATIVTLEADRVSVKDAMDILTAFLETPFSQEVRHIRRINQITEYEEKN